MDQTIYLRDKGWTRKKKGGKWKYIDNKTGREITGQRHVERINQLRIPPQWIDVWISSSSKSAIQVKGTDAQGRRQYLYSQEWINTQKSQKYDRMKLFMKDLGKFNSILQSCLKDRTLNKDKILSCMFKVMMKGRLRVGNERYAEENKTYGLTTLQKKHLVGDKLHFVGKSGIEHKISITGLCPRSKEVLQELWKRCKTSKSEIFPYSHVDMNNFLKEWMGREYTCKDFRTFFSNDEFIRSVINSRKELPKDPSKGALKRFILNCIDKSAKKLGHTRSISRKSYISEELIDYCLSQWPKAKKATYSKLFSVACS